MTDDIRNRTSLYLYGELPPQEETQFEEELANSPELQATVEEERRLIETLQARQTIEFSHDEVGALRSNLMQTIRQEATVASRRTWISRLAEFFDMSVPSFAWQAGLAVVLIAAGFWGGRTTELLRTAPDTPIVAEQRVPIGGSSLAAYQDIPDVRSISSGPGGAGIEIVVEERRTIRGNPNDPQIQALLMTMSRSSNAGMRLDTIDLLRQRTDDAQVRSVLVEAMLQDENDGIRLAALDSLSPYKDEVEVRQALMSSLRGDSNPGMRVSALELLTATPNRELVEVLQDVVRYDPNNYVRLKSEQTLEALNASIGMY
jgi:hypothetical protein